MQRGATGRRIGQEQAATARASRRRPGRIGVAAALLLVVAVLLLVARPECSRSHPDRRALALPPHPVSQIELPGPDRYTGFIYATQVRPAGAGGELLVAFRFRPTRDRKFLVDPWVRAGALECAYRPEDHGRANRPLEALVTFTAAEESAGEYRLLSCPGEAAALGNVDVER